MPLSHHDLCFGCGAVNVFGLQIEMEAEDGGVKGRFFVKQDHQGPSGLAHPGVLSAALEETMALALRAEGLDASLRHLELDLRGAAQVGTFVELSAAVDGGGDEAVRVTAEASVANGGEPLATTRATYLRRWSTGSV